MCRCVQMVSYLPPANIFVPLIWQTRQARVVSHVDMLNSCCCNAERNSWKAHLCTRSVSINISHVQKLLWGGRNSLWNGTIINHCLRGTSSYLCLSLWWLIPAEMGLAHLIKRSEPHTCIICVYHPAPAPPKPQDWGVEGWLQWLKKKKKRYFIPLFQPELELFVLWLSRQWSALNPRQEWASKGRRWTPNHTVTMRTCPVSRLRWEMVAASDIWYF